MSEDTQLATPTSHPEHRLRQAQLLAGQALEGDLQRLTDVIEHALLLGERTGIGATLDFFDQRIKYLRRAISHGPANHIEDAVKRCTAWVTNSSEFELVKRPEGTPPNKVVGESTRRFFGMDNLVKEK